MTHKRSYKDHDKTVASFAASLVKNNDKLTFDFKRILIMITDRELALIDAWQEDRWGCHWVRLHPYYAKKSKEVCDEVIWIERKPMAATRYLRCVVRFKVGK